MYGMPRAVLADNVVICLWCAVKIYDSVSKPRYYDIEDFVDRVTAGSILDKHRDRMAILCEGADDDCLCAEYCPICSDKLCRGGASCNCYAAQEHPCPFCNEIIDTDDIKKGYYERFHGFFCHGNCVNIALYSEVRGSQQSYYFHKTCFFDVKGDLAFKDPLQIDAPVLRDALCYGCGQLLLEDRWYKLFYGHEAQCDCSICEKTLRYGEGQTTHATVLGYHLGLQKILQQFWFRSADDLAAFSGYQTHSHIQSFIEGYAQGEKDA